jgi:hypothetical protein
MGGLEGIRDCYSDGERDGRLLAYFKADSGLYFGTSDDSLSFRAGTPSITEVGEEANCRFE